MTAHWQVVSVKTLRNRGSRFKSWHLQFKKLVRHFSDADAMCTFNLMRVEMRMLLNCEKLSSFKIIKLVLNNLRINY